jgi:hypothetical protein
MEINGKRVVDATKPVTIKITPKDVADGANKNPSECAAAKAAKHSVPDCINARVHVGRVYIEQSSKWVRYNTSEALRTEIVSFDRGGSFQPGAYTLRPMAESETTEGRARARRLKDHSGKNRNKLGSSPTKSPRKTLRVARIKRHEVTGIRPKGANR